MKVDDYLVLKKIIIDRGYSEEIDWIENIKPVDNPLSFWMEYGYVICNSGMKQQIAEVIWKKICNSIKRGGLAIDVFGHKPKARAIDIMFIGKEAALESYLASEYKLDWLESLDWIGPITKYHLAKNLGHDCAKPDRHLVRISGAEGTHAMCERISKAAGDRIATVDLVIWRAANLGLA